MKTCFTLLVFIFSFSTFSQQLVLKKPNVDKITKQLGAETQQDKIYLYLINNYNPTSKMTNKEVYEWAKEHLCAFERTFEHGISYAIEQCQEASGSRIEIRFPKMKRKALMQWIEQIDEIDNMSGPNKNVWKERNSKFEPKGPEAGCYFSITETRKNTIVNLRCGC